MPRRRRDQQAPQAAPGQPYGENQDQIQAQNVIPLPNVREGATSASPAPAPSGDPGAGGDPWAQVLAAAQGTPPPQGGLLRPSERPNQPVTEGLAMGAGRGPEALGPSRARAGTAADTFRLLAELTGSSRYQRMAVVAARSKV